MVIYYLAQKCYFRFLHPKKPIQGLRNFKISYRLKFYFAMILNLCGRAGSALSIESIRRAGPSGNKGVLPLYRAACYAVTNFLFGKLYLVLLCFSLFDFGLCDNYLLLLFNPFDACSQVSGNKPCRKHCAVFFDFRSNVV